MKLKYTPPPMSYRVQLQEERLFKEDRQQPSRLARLVFALALGSVLLLLVMSFSPRPLPLEQTLLSIAKYDVNIINGYMNPTESGLRHALRLNLMLLGGVVLLVGASYSVRPYVVVGPDAARKLFSFSMTIACATSIFVALAQPAYELMSFSPVETLMTNPGSLPIFGHRLLLVWLADALKLIVPSLSYRRCYLATQLVAAFGTTYMVGSWSALFVGKQWKFLGQILLAVMLIPNFLYCSFYDIPMVFFYTACLTLLYKRYYVWFIALVGIATLNHENALLLVVAAAFTLYGVASQRTWLGVPLAAFAVWLTARASMEYFFPMKAHFEPHVWSNLLDLAHPPGDLFKSAATLFFWWICGAIGFRYSDQFVRRTTVLLPGLVAATFVAGHFNEARQFDAYIPVAIALILAYVRKELIPHDTTA
jgi:hypothetical protein